METGRIAGACRKLMDLVFPRECVVCGLDGDWLCLKCYESIERPDCQVCHKCGEPRKLGRFCVACQKGFCLDGIISATGYENEQVKKVIKSFKFRFIKELSQPLGMLLADTAARSLAAHQQGFGGSGWSICYVPLHARRERWRGFNQAKVLSLEISKRLDLTVESDKIIRLRHGMIQSKLSNHDRKTNVQGAFSWSGNSRLSGKILLVDDVATTASTLNECARILKANGAREVWGLVVARG